MALRVPIRSTTGAHEPTRALPGSQARAELKGWFFVSFARELEGSAIHTLRIMDREIVVFRTESGAIEALDAYCPHLGAHLGKGAGEVRGEKIHCRYHGRSYCSKSKVIASYPTASLNGLVFCWFGGGAPEWGFADELRDFAASTVFDEVAWSYFTDIRNTVSNAVDNLHFQHVHSSGEVELAEHSAEGPLFRCRMINENCREHLRHQLGFEVPRQWIAGMRFETDNLLLGLGILKSETVVYRHGKALSRFQSLTVWQPEARDVVHVKHLWYDRRRLFRFHPTAWYLKRVVRTIVEEDLQVLKHCAYVPEPSYGRGDEIIRTFRRWSTQFTAGWG